MELLFVSGSTSHLSRSQPDFYFTLEKSSGIPIPFSAKPWDRSKISPLRDRLMIAWVFTHREAMRELYKIVTSINTALVQDETKTPDRRPQTSSPKKKKKIVVVACEDGLVLSPCFVEKLYDHYLTSPPVDDLIVKRSHIQMENAQIPRERLKWQQLSCGTSHPRRKTEFDNIQQLKILTTSRDWLDLPVDLSAGIEEAYNKDPLSNNVRIGGVVIDFESGHMTTLQTKQVSFLRSSVIPKSYSVQARSIQHKEYKHFVQCFEAAGILPYSVHPLTGEAVFLIGHITYGGGTWCDFGGLKMRYRVNRETPAETAARECFEESLGVFGSSAELLRAIRSYKENNVFKIVNEDSLYVGHFLRIPFDHYPSKFATRVLKEYGQDQSVEVDSIRWIPLSSIRMAVQLTQSSASKIAVQPIRENEGSLDSCNLRLRHEFAQSLCIAEDRGVLDSIEYIAAMNHRGIIDSTVSGDDLTAGDDYLSKEHSPRMTSDPSSCNLEPSVRTSPLISTRDDPGTLAPTCSDFPPNDTPEHPQPMPLSVTSSSEDPVIVGGVSGLSLSDGDPEDPKTKPSSDHVTDNRQTISDHVTDNTSDQKYRSPHRAAGLIQYGMFSGKFSYTDPFLQYV